MYIFFMKQRILPENDPFEAFDVYIKTMAYTMRTINITCYRLFIIVAAEINWEKMTFSLSYFYMMYCKYLYSILIG